MLCDVPVHLALTATVLNDRKYEIFVVDVVVAAVVVVVERKRLN